MSEKPPTWGQSSVSSSLSKALAPPKHILGGNPSCNRMVMHIVHHCIGRPTAGCLS